jgi:hypothetical protein
MALPYRGGSQDHRAAAPPNRDLKLVFRLSRKRHSREFRGSFSVRQSLTALQSGIAAILAITRAVNSGLTARLQGSGVERVALLDVTGLVTFAEPT